MRLTSLALAAGLATVAVLGTGTAAHAERATIKDKRADVVLTTMWDEGYQERQLGRTESKKSGIDAKSVRYDHRRRTVSVTVKFSRLKSDAGLSVEFYAPGSDEPDYELHGFLDSSDADVMDAGYEHACSASLKGRKGRNGWMTATVKRSCLGDLPKVRMAATAFRVVEKDASVLIYGDALSAKKIRTAQKSRALAAG
ncbi:hypothetical protein [Aeromicrobium sp. IC_218]|uniref:hypothetical protein n=1 Tax=Aeromicrobium sp. IC_218 TaxID=2545468 RepID=UPI0013F3DE0C|nr:hypothetical protein [Aeromicrobium sp. IC_218]